MGIQFISNTESASIIRRFVRGGGEVSTSGMILKIHRKRIRPLRWHSKFVGILLVGIQVLIRQSIVISLQIHISS